MVQQQPFNSLQRGLLCLIPSLGFFCKGTSPSPKSWSPFLHPLDLDGSCDFCDQQNAVDTMLCPFWRWLLTGLLPLGMLLLGQPFSHQAGRGLSHTEIHERASSAELPTNSHMNCQDLLCGVHGAHKAGVLTLLQTLLRRPLVWQEALLGTRAQGAWRARGDSDLLFPLSWVPTFLIAMNLHFRGLGYRTSPPLTVGETESQRRR